MRHLVDFGASSGSPAPPATPPPKQAKLDVNQSLFGHPFYAPPLGLCRGYLWLLAEPRHSPFTPRLHCCVAESRFPSLCPASRWGWRCKASFLSFRAGGKGSCRANPNPFSFSCCLWMAGEGYQAGKDPSGPDPFHSCCQSVLEI